jgi:DNA mismatch endonuclease (patch repair protein)
MTDVHDSKTRSFNMSRIKSKDTKPELLVRKFLFANGYRYRLHTKDLPGKPDIVLRRIKTAIFINGCFWHGHDCPASKLPTTKIDFWFSKILNNKKRDEGNMEKLAALGWNIIIIWQCGLQKKKVEETLKTLLERLSLGKTT